MPLFNPSGSVAGSAVIALPDGRTSTY